MYTVLFVLRDDQSSRPKHVEIQGIYCSLFGCVSLDIKFKSSYVTEWDDDTEIQ